MDLMDLCSDRVKQDKLCGNSSYHAAGDRKGRADGKRVTGRFLMGCPHLVLLSMATMPAAYGQERYGYAYLMLSGEHSCTLSCSTGRALRLGCCTVCVHLLCLTSCHLQEPAASSSSPMQQDRVPLGSKPPLHWAVQ